MVGMRAVFMPAAWAAAREMLNARTANCSQAALAWNFPEGRCARALPYNSAMTCSMIACPR